jgi:hypothetical protein
MVYMDEKRKGKDINIKLWLPCSSQLKYILNISL